MTEWGPCEPGERRCTQGQESRRRQNPHLIEGSGRLQAGPTQYIRLAKNGGELSTEIINIFPTVICLLFGL